MNHKTCMLLHGLASSPYEMKDLASFLKEKNLDITVPAHTDLSSFQNNFHLLDMQYWKDQINKELTSEKYSDKELIIIGSSLGGILAAYAAITSDKVKKIILCSPPFLLKKRLLLSLPFVYRIKPKIPVKIPSGEENNYFPYFPVPVIRQLMKFGKYVIKQSSRIKADVHIFYSSNDKNVDIRGINKFLKKIKTPKENLHFLPNSPHAVLAPAYKNRYEVYKQIEGIIERKD